MPVLDRYPDTLNFDLPDELEAHAPPEARSLRRDEVRLLVSQCDGWCIEHHQFRELPGVLRAGDLLIANDSATLPAAVTAQRDDGSRLSVHFSTHLPADLWVVEPRRTAVHEGETLHLDGGASLRLLAPYPNSARLWVARASTDVPSFLRQHGRPITYDHVQPAWPIEAYQTVYAREPGSAEMPSAGRPFTPDVLAELAHRGIQFLTLTLHTGVASLEGHERPYAEEYTIPWPTADAVNQAHQAGRRVIAIGTTVVRALESAALLGDGQVVPTAHSWTELMVTPATGVHVIDGLLTGFHEPRASHLAMLEAIAGRPHLERAYAAALEGRYLWHEFGDVHLILR